ncbi:MAG: MFS transporter, partial [Thermoplasmata archaeon]
QHYIFLLDLEVPLQDILVYHQDKDALYAYTPELFNERNRATATGTCTSMARVGMIIGPYLPGIISFNSSLLIFALVWIIGATVVFLLPETLKKK